MASGSIAATGSRPARVTAEPSAFAAGGGRNLDVGSVAARSFVDVRSVTLRYGGDPGEPPALQDTNLVVGRGECAAVVGPSGCGKSSLLKLISGLSRPSNGQVCVAGGEVKKPLKTVGMAFQNSLLLPWRTTLQNLLLPLEIVQPHRRRLRAEYDRYVESARALLAAVGLTNVEDRFPWQLSGGMQQRVSLCRALIHRPDILLLDEPFAALDAFTREELWEVLQTLWLEQRFTLLLVTHDLTEAAYLADEVHVMSARPGRIIFRSRIALPRPRVSEMRFSAGFVEHVHELRAHIGRAREA